LRLPWNRTEACGAKREGETQLADNTCEPKMIYLRALWKGEPGKSLSWDPILYTPEKRVADFEAVTYAFLSLNATNHSFPRKNGVSRAKMEFPARK